VLYFGWNSHSVYAMITSMITIDSISKTMGTRLLFEGITTTFTTGNRYGLTGPNGAGKSTLMKIMMGSLEPNSGTVILPKKVGFLRQNIEEFEHMRVLDVVIMGNEPLWAAMQERESLYDGEMTDEVGMKLAELEEVVADEDGYSADSEAEALLEGMGISSEFHEKTMSEIPTDLQFRVLLCQAIFGHPEALLLDEPTNHLDLESITWLETFLKGYDGTLIVVSHDRHFLNSVTSHIADIDYDTLIVYPGNYDDMIVAKSSTRSRAEQESKSKDKKVAQLKEFVSKFSAGTRASQVQSRLKEINRLKPQELKQSNIQRPYIRFPNAEKPGGKMSIRLEKVSKAFDNPVITNLSTEIYRGEKIGIIGNNGRGKTTLLRMVAGELAPDSGKIELGHEVSIGYFPQNHNDVVDKTIDITLFDWLKNVESKAFDQEIRGVLGKMLFSGDDVFKKVANLSGGETARLILAGLMLQGFNVLVFDEPNNHLDLEAVSALAFGLKEFPGTVLVASHDRDLISNACDRIIALESTGPNMYSGTIDDYLAANAT
jgi:ATPase subunit of ABC transporter with duplicated ATPase domains